ncbi:polygalacturonase-like [Senna tora]|uniref:Polygalacturonase-like n=1 Tax=Senna tora TaxID=362788 RepID=A0A834SQQ5_9FABA|nr:polygalacturonase-like [Senna tora]
MRFPHSSVSVLEFTVASAAQVDGNQRRRDLAATGTNGEDSYVEAQHVIFDIRKYGASPNCDMTQALKNAWNDACASTNAAKILIPAGTYKLGQVDLRGTYKAPIEVQVDGIILAPANPDKLDGNAQWVKFGRPKCMETK